MIHNSYKNIFYITLILALSACNFRGRSIQDFISNPTNRGDEQIVEPIRAPSSVVVCRSRQCAPAKLSMSREYIYNSLLQLFDNNNYQKALLCTADATSHTCLENYVQIPLTAGITPTYAYIDHVKITDVIVGKGADKINLILNYNVTYGGQTPDCTPSKSILFAKNINHILLEDSGYTCKMTSIGQTSIKTVFAIDYIDLDYGYIGGYYSIGFSGPAYGGGNGYMIIRLPKDAYPLSPTLMAPKQTPKSNKNFVATQANMPASGNENLEEQTSSGVQIFPIAR